jgi:cyclopropane fatty-acyl-phospholipid synthase-like methyltransferase
MLRAMAHADVDKMKTSLVGPETPGGRPAYSGRVRYTASASLRYQHRNPRRHEAEMRLIERGFQLVPPGRVLDVPCGCGRVGFWLARQGFTVTAGDLSDAMLDITREEAARQSLAVDVQKQDVERLQYDAKSFDSVISFRLFHHFPNHEIRARAIAELCRVSRRHVLISYFSPWSTSALKQRGQIFFFNHPKKKFPTSLHELRGYFEANGFRLVRDFAQSPFFHTLHLAVFERVK